MKLFSKLAFAFIIFYFISCQEKKDFSHIINMCHDLNKTASSLKEYNSDKIGILKVEFVNNREHLTPFYLFAKKTQLLLDSLEEKRSSFVDSFFINLPKFYENDYVSNSISKSSISQTDKDKFCTTLIHYTYQINALIDSIIKTNIKGYAISTKDSLNIKNSLPNIFQNRWLVNLNQPLSKIIFHEKLEENTFLWFCNLKVQIQETQFKILSFIDKKAASFHRYSWHNEFHKFIQYHQNPIFENEEFTANIGLYKRFINDVPFEVEIEGVKLPVIRGDAVFKTRNYKIGVNKVKGKIKFWNPIMQYEQSHDIYIEFNVLKK